MTVVAILQARMSSSRLPNKVLTPIMNEPMLGLQVDRVRHARTIDRLVVATSTEAADDPIKFFCTVRTVECYRGSLDDVLDRFYRAAIFANAEHIVRLTGDCPLTDWNVIDRVVEYHLAGSFDYTSNVSPPTWPDGLDVEVLKIQALEAAWREARLPSEREHVTPFVRSHPQRFRCGNVVNNVDLSAHRWTVDDPRDLEFVRQVFEALYPTNRMFKIDDILRLLDAKPELGLINAGIERNEGFVRSLKEDSQFLFKQGGPRD